VTTLRLITTSTPPTGRIIDFDLVIHEDRLLLVGSPDRYHLACTWDPVRDQWAEYRLDNAADLGDYTELTAFAAAVVDGRIVIGGGGDHHGFAMWDLESGNVRLSEWMGGVSSATRAVVGGRQRFVVGGSSNTNVELWDPALTEAPDSPTSPVEDMVEVGDLFTNSGAGSGVAAGMLGGRPVLLANSHTEGVVVWGIDEDRRLTKFEDLEHERTDFAFATVDGRLLAVAASPSEIRLGDPETGTWEEPLPFPSGEVTCLDAATISGTAIAVAGFEDGAVCVWDLARRKLIAESEGGSVDQVYRGVGNRVYAIRVAELDGAQVIITAHNGGAVRVWELPTASRR
jgi:WD40 repeat protein